eukprot:SAG11_NODE_3018_length_2759_cov_2.253383_4_plen_123_part_01
MNAPTMDLQRSSDLFSVPQTASLSIENVNGLDVGFDVAGALTLLNAHGTIGTLQVQSTGICHIQQSICTIDTIEVAERGHLSVDSGSQLQQIQSLDLSHAGTVELNSASFVFASILLTGAGTA